jgi:hypothetical protein
MYGDLLTLLGSALISFLVAWLTVRGEESKGRALLYSICCRFLISSFNTIDTNKNKIKTGELEKEQYVKELESLITDLEALASNPIFVKFVSRHELAPMMVVQLRREAVEHRMSKTFAMNERSIKFVIDTFDWCKRLPWGVWIKKHKKMNELADFFRKWQINAQQAAPADAAKPRA